MCEAYTVHGEHSMAMTGSGNAQVAFKTRLARALDTTGGYVTNRGGTVIMCEMFNKTHRAPKEQGDNWKAQDVAPTLNESDLGSGHRAVTLISSMEGSPVKTYQWPATGRVLGESAAVCGLSLSGCCPSCGHDGRSLRMSQDFYPPVLAPAPSVRTLNGASFVTLTPTTCLMRTDSLQSIMTALSAAQGDDYCRLIKLLSVVQTSQSSSTPWANSGIAQGGRYWTRSTSESRNAAGACSLSAVLEPQVSERYYLSAKAAAGILRRAERRGKALPEPLEAALRSVAGAQTPTEPPS